MAATKWTTRTLSGGRVRLTGAVRLPCGHKIQEGAQVRDNPAAIATGKRTIQAMLDDLIRDHTRECGK